MKTETPRLFPYVASIYCSYDYKTEYFLIFAKDAQDALAFAALEVGDSKNSQLRGLRPFFPEDDMMKLRRSAACPAHLPIGDLTIELRNETER